MGTGRGRKGEKVAGESPWDGILLTVSTEEASLGRIGMKAAEGV